MPESASSSTGDAHAVGRPAADVGGIGLRQVHVLEDLVELGLDVGNGRRRVLVGRGIGRVLMLLGQRGRVRGFRRRVVDRDVGAVGGDLGIALVALKLETEASVLADPYAAAAASEQGVAALDRRRVDQVVRELHVRREPRDGRSGQRVVDRVRARGSGRNRTGAACGRDGHDRRADDDCDHGNGYETSDGCGAQEADQTVAHETDRTPGFGKNSESAPAGVTYRDWCTSFRIGSGGMIQHA
jgi:hypothetical protein